MSYLDPDLSGPWAQVLEDRFRDAPAERILEEAIDEVFAGRIALVSSFGAESAVLLHMVSRIAPDLPVLFVDTGKLFGETLRYRDRLVRLLGLTDLRIVGPEPEEVDRHDPSGVLWRDDPDRCCFVRKVVPLERALSPWRAWISGRKRYQGGERTRLAKVEAVDGRVKFNPLADWSRADIARYFARHELLRHPLEADGFRSIGCMPCTDRVAPDEREAPRAGRWRGQAKTECGIHLGVREAARRAGLDSSGP
ncbi:MAG: phosphoadenylyl-sulfate reductase [Alphaproteobacteria bacterium]|nr:MAG: phosphoadenylyl-sulfate reductase [Alphaproteobacteria bacterium]